MNLEAIEHVMNSVYAHAISEDIVVIRLRTQKGDLKECRLYYGETLHARRPNMDWTAMKCVATDRLFDYFEAEIVVDYQRISYYFWISDDRQSLYHYEHGFYENTPSDLSGFYRINFLRREEIADVPAWAKEAIIYQIYPDSFATSKAFIAATERRLHNQFGDQSYSKNVGTLEGICDNLPYLEELGINCIYLNPIFTSPSYHKYDTQDYFSVDPCFGDNEIFKELVRRAHGLNIKVILDGVFNHCGANFFAFKDVLEKGENSRYKDWFYQLQFPVVYSDNPNYACFFNYKKMPKLNTGHPEVRDYLIKVGTYWIREADIDGWRMDVADEVDHYFWKCFRKAVKVLKPDAFLIGEVWGDAEPWLEGDEFDSTMNYRFSDICRKYFAERKINAADFDVELHQLRMRYRKNMIYAQMNLLDSHDVPRFLHYCGGDIERLKLAVLFQMFAEGIPSIYYGDEKGITGFLEAEYRRPMVWENLETVANLLSFYKKAIAIRKKYALAILGEYITLMKDFGKNIYGFIRQNGTERLTIVLNNSDFNCNVELLMSTGEEIAVDLLSDCEYPIIDSSLKLTIPPMKGVVLVYY
jgi:cyclomaltodextrinase / maltogenic alpha-amylase / neopullulanase